MTGPRRAQDVNITPSPTTIAQVWSFFFDRFFSSILFDLFFNNFLGKKYRDEEAHIAILLSLGSWIENSANAFL